MHVGNRLARLRPGVEDDTVSGVGDTLTDSYLVGVGDDVGQQPVVCLRELGHIGVVLTRDNKYVNGSLRINVAERDGARITGHYGRRDVTGGNTAEQAVRHTEDLNVYPAGNVADIYGCTTANPRCATPLVQRSRQFLAFRHSGMSHARALGTTHR
jgi:hypothetical protein